MPFQFACTYKVSEASHIVVENFYPVYEITLYGTCALNTSRFRVLNVSAHAVTFFLTAMISAEKVLKYPWQCLEARKE